MTDISELRLQQNCFMWFHNTYPHLRGLFFRIKNENTNRISGAIGKATGIIPGVADSCLLLRGFPYFIEFKTITWKQSSAQREWEAIVRKQACGYKIIKSLEEFKQLCQTLDL